MHLLKASLKAALTQKAQKITFVLDSHPQFFSRHVCSEFRSSGIGVLTTGDMSQLFDFLFPKEKRNLVRSGITENSLNISAQQKYKVIGFENQKPWIFIYLENSENLYQEDQLQFKKNLDTPRISVSTPMSQTPNSPALTATKTPSNFDITTNDQADLKDAKVDLAPDTALLNNTPTVENSFSASIDHFQAIEYSPVEGDENKATSLSETLELPSLLPVEDTPPPLSMEQLFHSPSPLKPDQERKIIDTNTFQAEKNVAKTRPEDSNRPSEAINLLQPQEEVNFIKPLSQAAQWPQTPSIMPSPQEFQIQTQPERPSHQPIELAPALAPKSNLYEPGYLAHRSPENQPQVEAPLTLSFGPDIESVNVGTTSPTRKIDQFLKLMIKNRASDLHLTIGQPIIMRVDGDIVRIDKSSLSVADMEDLLGPIIPEKNKKEFIDCSDTDFAYEIQGVGRFRVNLFRDRCGVGGVLRHIPAQIQTFEQLKLPSVFKKFCELNKGLVLVTGPTGCGKSTTLAAMIDYINKSKKSHIITIEDPIEFVHPQQESLINQREIGRHTGSFKKALRAALREDPDIVLVGEMRDLETVSIGIETAETGHLVFGTLHTNTAVSTIDRIIDQFSKDQQEQIRMMLASSLKGVITQTLLKKKGGGRVAAHEILVSNDAVSAMIREAKNHMIANHMTTQRADGNQMLNEHLIKLIENNLVDSVEAFIKCIDKKDFIERCKRKNIKLPLPELEGAA